jgi:lipopolysaccharide export system permease protein
MAGLLVISILPSSIPLAFLIGLLAAFSRLSNDSEIIAVKASGISLLRIAMPTFFLAGAIGIFLSQLNNHWVPSSITTYKSLEEKVRNTKVSSIIKEGAFTSGFFDMLIYAEKVDRKKNRLQKVFIFDERESKNPMIYVAKEGSIIPTKTKQDLGLSIIFKLANGAMHHSNLEQRSYEKIDFDAYQLYLKIHEAGDQPSLNPNMIPEDELLKIIRQNPIGSPTYREHMGEYWRRNALALSPIAFVLLGIGLGTFRQRSTRLNGPLVGLIIAIFYWTLQVWGASAVTKGLISPFLGMHAANLILLTTGIVSFKKSSW